MKRAIFAAAMAFAPLSESIADSSNLNSSAQMPELTDATVSFTCTRGQPCETYYLIGSTPPVRYSFNASSKTGAYLAGRVTYHRWKIQTEEIKKQSIHSDHAFLTLDRG